MCYMVKHTSLLLALCIDDQLSVIKSPGFTVRRNLLCFFSSLIFATPRVNNGLQEAVRHCFTAALLGEGIHWYGSKLTKRFLVRLPQSITSNMHVAHRISLLRSL